MNPQSTPAQRHVIDALISIAGLDTHSFECRGDSQRITIRHNDCTYVLDEDGSLKDDRSVQVESLAGYEAAKRGPDAPSLLEASQLDEMINQIERCPTGEDYNTVLAIVLTALSQSPVITFGPNSADIAVQFIASIPGYNVALNGYDVKLEMASEDGLMVCDWTPAWTAPGLARLVKWDSVKTIHIQ